MAQRHLPGSGVRFFDFRHELSDAWHRFRQPHQDGQSKRQLDVRLKRNMFPFIPGRSIVRIERLDPTASLRSQREESIGGDHDAMIAICFLGQTIADRIVVARILNEYVGRRLEPCR